ncbi:MAG: NADH:ubiquinone oxidoreductase subunit NDUFA12 [Pseudomonadota bacterium]
MFLKLFTWWNSSTLGALFDIKRRASYVGSDDYGNRYFEDRNTSLDDDNFHRRYVIYKGLAEPSKVPADWHGWLHHTVEVPPTEAPLARKGWETDHSPNLTGTLYATKPKGAISNTTGGKRQDTYADYDAWTPDA